MLSTDKMGGFIAVKIIPVSDIGKWIHQGESVQISPKPGKDFFEISSKKNGISPSVTDAQDKSGVIYSINIAISAKKSTGIKFTPFNKYVVICTNPMGQHYVFGSYDYPLTGSSVPILSDRPGGAVGETIKFTGKQPFPPITVVS